MIWITEVFLRTGFRQGQRGPRRQHTDDRSLENSVFRNKKPMVTLLVGRKQLCIWPSPGFHPLGGQMTSRRAASSISLMLAGAGPLRSELLPQYSSRIQARTQQRPQLGPSLVFVGWRHRKASTRKGLPNLGEGRRILFNPLTHLEGSREGQPPPVAENFKESS